MIKTGDFTDFLGKKLSELQTKRMPPTKKASWPPPKKFPYPRRNREKWIDETYFSDLLKG